MTLMTTKTCPSMPMYRDYDPDFQEAEPRMEGYGPGPTQTLKVEVGLYSRNGQDPLHFTTEEFSPFFSMFAPAFETQPVDLSTVTAENLFSGDR